MADAGLSMIRHAHGNPGRADVAAALGERRRRGRGWTMDDDGRHQFAIRMRSLAGTLGAGALLAGAAEVAVAAVKIGDHKNNVLKGGDRADLLRGKGGADGLSGGGGGDKLYGGPGADKFAGGKGNDVIFAADGEKDAAINCGPGKDKAFVDPAEADSAGGCENLVFAS
jgi:Ca2+-binding RTX toxin-like protein